MNVATVLPWLAERYWRARGRAEVQKRLYQAATSSDFRPQRGDGRSGDSVMEHARGSIRDWARYLDENSDLAGGILNALVDGFIGTGITVQPMVRTPSGELHAQANSIIRNRFDRWALKPETSQQIPWGETQRTLGRSWLRDGEVLVQHVSGSVGYDFPTPIRYAIELIEADFLPFDKTDTKQGIVHGVERNAWGQVKAFHLYKVHPGDTAIPYTPIATRMETKRVPADQLVHLKFTRRIGQARGISIFHSITHRLSDLNNYEESERVAAQIAASFGAVIRRGADYGYDASADGQAMTLSSGLILDKLGPGEEVDFLDPKRPSSQLKDFRSAMLKATAAGVGTSYSTISRDYQGTYSSQRQELVEARIGYTRLGEYFVSQFVRPVYERWLGMALLSGEIGLDGIDLETLLDADYRGPALPWIDPAKEMSAEVDAVDSGFKSRQQVIRERGGDPDKVTAELNGDTWEKPQPMALGGDSDDSDEETTDEDAPEDENSDRAIPQHTPGQAVTPGVYFDSDTGELIRVFEDGRIRKAV